MTLNDVAHDAGVSYQTVSRVVNKHPSVAGPTRERVLASIEKLDYRPNQLARGLVTRRSYTIGIVAIGAAFYGPAQMIVNIDRSLSQRGYGLTMTTIREFTYENVRAAIQELKSRAVDGLVMIAPIQDSVLGYAKELFGQTPFVLVDAEPGSSAPSILIDQREGGRLATQHLVDLGHRRIAEIHGPLAWNDARLRHEAWCSTLAKAGLEAGPTYEGDWTASSGYQGMTKILAQHPKFTGLVVGNDQMALGALHRLREAGLAAPEDISVVGFDDIPESGYFDPPLTTVRQDFTALGKRSADYLIALIDDPRAATPQEMLKPSLVLRGSTRRTGDGDGPR